MPSYTRASLGGAVVHSWLTLANMSMKTNQPVGEPKIDVIPVCDNLYPRIVVWWYRLFVG